MGLNFDVSRKGRTFENENKTVCKMLTDKIQYTVALIAEFAAHFHLTDAQAMRYLQQYHALELCDKHYDYLHTQSFESNVEDLATNCRRMGGTL